MKNYVTVFLPNIFTTITQFLTIFMPTLSFFFYRSRDD